MIEAERRGLARGPGVSSKVVVTGGAGFLGSHVADALVARERAVVLLDDLSTGSLENCRECLQRPEVEFRRGDVRDPGLVREACAGADVILHLAARKIPRYGNRLDTLLVNSGGVLNVLEAARASNSKVILASTSDVYGKSQALPFSEQGDSVLGPPNVARWSYAVSKMMGEHLVFGYAERYGVRPVILRLFGSYGPRENRGWLGGAPSAFIEALLQGKEIEIHGDGQQTRSFCYVSDTVDAILAAIDREEAVGQVINVGSDEEITILDLARLIAELAGMELDGHLKFIPYESFTGRPYEDVIRRVPDLVRARTILGVRSQVPMREGLVQTIAWHRRQIDQERGTPR